MIPRGLLRGSRVDGERPGFPPSKPAWRWLHELPWGSQGAGRACRAITWRGEQRRLARCRATGRRNPARESTILWGPRTHLAARAHACVAAALKRDRPILPMVRWRAVVHGANAPPLGR